MAKISLDKIKNLKPKNIKFLGKPLSYLKESKNELIKVTWPTRKEAVHYTLVVIAISAIVAIFLGLSDFLLSKGLNILLKK